MTRDEYRRIVVARSQCIERVKTVASNFPDSIGDLLSDHLEAIRAAVDVLEHAVKVCAEAYEKITEEADLLEGVDGPFCLFTLNESNRPEFGSFDYLSRRFMQQFGVAEKYQSNAGPLVELLRNDGIENWRLWDKEKALRFFGVSAPRMSQEELHEVSAGLHPEFTGNQEVEGVVRRRGRRRKV